MSGVEDHRFAQGQSNVDHNSGIWYSLFLIVFLHITCSVIIDHFYSWKWSIHGYLLASSLLLHGILVQQGIISTFTLLIEITLSFIIMSLIDRNKPHVRNLASKLNVPVENPDIQWLQHRINSNKFGHITCLADITTIKDLHHKWYCGTKYASFKHDKIELSEWFDPDHQHFF